MAIWQKLFRWRSRVKVGAPDVAGDIETLTAHVADPNAHPDYLKKGQAVPTGQEQTMIATHRADPQAHAKTSVRRAELLKTLEQYKAAKDSELADTVNNYTKTNPPPTRHVVTAYVLAQVLAAFKSEMSGIVNNVGNGRNLIYSNDSGVLTESHESVGTSTRPVYLFDGTLTELAYDVVLTGSDQTINGVKTFSSLPKSSAAPTQDNQLVNKAYVDAKTNTALPVGFCVVTDKSVSTAAQVAAKMTYGTWALMSEVANVGYMWKRTA